MRPVSLFDSYYLSLQLQECGNERKRLNLPHRCHRSRMSSSAVVQFVSIESPDSEGFFHEHVFVEAVSSGKLDKLFTALPRTNPEAFHEGYLTLQFSRACTYIERHPSHVNLIGVLTAGELPVKALFDQEAGEPVRVCVSLPTEVRQASFEYLFRTVLRPPFVHRMMIAGSPARRQSPARSGGRYSSVSRD